MIKLRSESLNLLIRCLEKYKPSYIPLVKSHSSDNYTETFYNELRQIVGEELSAEGFSEDWEPNEYGLKLEGLIDEIGRLFMDS